MSDRPVNPDLAPIDLAHIAPFRLGGLRVEPATRSITGPDGTVEMLEPRAMQVLVALHRAKGRTLSHDDLISSCWAGRVVGDNAINRVISQLRKNAAKFGDDGFTIATVAKVGYRLGPTATVMPEPGRPFWRRWMAVAALILLVGLGYLLFALANRDGAAPGDGRIALAVLPIAGANEDDRLMGAGFAAEIRSQLGRHPAFRVIGPGSTQLAVVGDKGVPQIGTSLAVDYVLEGQVGRTNGSLVLSLNLHDATSGETIWSETYRGALDEAFAFQQAATFGIIDHFAFPHDGVGADSKRTHDHARYLIAKALIMERGFGPINKARSILEELTSAGSASFAPAWSARAMAVSLIAASADSDDEARRQFDAALTFADRALEIEPALADAFAVKGLVLLSLGDRGAEAKAALERALALDPNDAQAWYWLSNLHMSHGDAKAAMEAGMKVLEIDPFWPRAQRAVDLAVQMGQPHRASVFRETSLLRHPLPQMRELAHAQMAVEATDYSKALTHIDKALAMQGHFPDHRNADFNRFWLFTYLGIDWDRPFDEGLPAPFRRYMAGEMPLGPSRLLIDRDTFEQIIASDDVMNAIVAGGECPGLFELSVKHFGSFRTWAEPANASREHTLTILPWLMLCRDSNEFRNIAVRIEKHYDLLHRREAMSGLGLEQLARLKAMMGQTEAALQLLEEARKMGWPHYLPGTSLMPLFSPRLQGNPLFRSLNGDPRFDSFAHQLESNRVKERAEAQIALGLPRRR